MTQKRLTPEERLQVLARYKAGESSERIADDIGVSGVAIRATLRKLGCALRSASDAHRTAPALEDAFDALTPDALYWMGFLMTDGSVAPRRGQSGAKIEVTLQAGDRDHLLLLDRFTGGDGILGSPGSRVRAKATKRATYYRWAMRSDHVAAALAAHGIVPRKTKVATPSAALAASPDFWRGCWDGDGSVKDGNGCPALALTGSFPLIHAFCGFFTPHCPEYPLKPRPSGHTGCTAYINLYGHGAMALLRLIYEGAPLALLRKKQTAEQLLEQYRDKAFRILKVDIHQADTFPYTYTDLAAAEADFARLKALNAAELVKPLTKVQAPGLHLAEITPSRIGVVASHTFHEAVRMTARTSGHKSPAEMWNDPVDRQTIIDEAENRKHSSLRASMSANCRPCWGFRPAVAKAIYQHLGGGKPLRILDPCAGWGDRLTAALSLGNLVRYRGFDPNRAMKLIYERMVNCFDGHADARVECAPFEDVDPGAGCFDLAFTSPPYFDYEEYSDDPEQSFKRYRTAEAWREGFLAPMLRKAAAALVPGGTLAVNLSDAGRAPLVQWLTEEAARLPSLRFTGTLLLPTGNFTRGQEGAYCWQKVG